VVCFSGTRNPAQPDGPPFRQGEHDIGRGRLHLVFQEQPVTPEPRNAGFTCVPAAYLAAPGLFQPHFRLNRRRGPGTPQHQQAKKAADRGREEKEEQEKMFRLEHCGQPWLNAL
jgi:hypothetical protein